jgi:hypothetical protein
MTKHMQQTVGVVVASLALLASVGCGRSDQERDMLLQQCIDYAQDIERSAVTNAQARVDGGAESYAAMRDDVHDAQVNRATVLDTCFKQYGR